MVAAGRMRSWAVEKVWGDDKYMGEPLPALNALRAAGELPTEPCEVADATSEGNGHALKMEASCLAVGVWLVVVRDHGEAKLVVLVQDNGVVS